jgi:methylenetetrahydrofolate--tRNA-(uracil-5-)-methyltransferase
MGSLLEAITSPEREKHFQPTNINFGLIPPLAPDIAELVKRDKSLKKQKMLDRAKTDFTLWKNSLL